MTEQEYNAQNAKGYEGDEFIHEELKKLCEKFNVNTIIETGTYHGGSTRRLATLAPKVFTIESKRENFDYSRNSLMGISNVHCIFGNSSVMLPGLLHGLNVKDSFLFFLDAHWEAHNPLIDELKAIAAKGLKPLIFIHDFKNPQHPDFGYDSYAGQDYDFNWIKAAVELIYGADGYAYHYNEKASGAKRGVIYIYPKEEAPALFDGIPGVPITAKVLSTEPLAELINDGVYKYDNMGYLVLTESGADLKSKGSFITSFKYLQEVHKYWATVFMPKFNKVASETAPAGAPERAPIIHISVIHPSRGRAAQARDTYAKWISKLSGKYDIEYIVSIDFSDPQIESYKSLFAGTQAKVIINHNSSIVDAVNVGGLNSSGKLIIVNSDDFDCPKDWDETIYTIFKSIHNGERPRDGLVLKTFDGQEPWIVTLPIVDRAWYEREGCIYQPGYKHMFCDTDLTHKAELMGSLIFRNDILFKQDHSKKDDQNVRTDNTWAQGQAFYFERVKQRFGLPEDTNVWKLGDYAKGHIAWCLERIYS